MGFKKSLGCEGMKDCTDLNPTEVRDLFYSVFPDYPLVNNSQSKQIRSKEQDLQNPIIVDEEIGDWLDLPTNLDYAVYKRNLGVLNDTAPIVYGLSSLRGLSGPFTYYIVISSDFRGFLANEHYVIYVGDNYKFYWKSKNSIIKSSYFFEEENWGIGAGSIFFNIIGKGEFKRWVIFQGPDGKTNDMVDITDMICGSAHQFTFMNWKKNPWEVKG